MAVCPCGSVLQSGSYPREPRALRLGCGRALIGVTASAATARAVAASTRFCTGLGDDSFLLNESMADGPMRLSFPTVRAGDALARIEPLATAPRAGHTSFCRRTGRGNFALRHCHSREEQASRSNEAAMLSNNTDLVRSETR